MFYAVLYDLDGTLIDSFAAITAGVNHVRSFYELPPLAEPDVRRRVGHGILDLMEQVVPNGNPELDAQRYSEHHPSVMFPMTQVLPGVREILSDLKLRKVKQGICSNKPVEFSRRLIHGLGLGEYLDGIFGPEDSGKPKPDPAMLLLALERFGVAPQHALYLGDMTIDIDTGRAAGVTTWVVPTGSEPLESLMRSNPDRILRDMNDLRKAEFADLFPEKTL